LPAWPTERHAFGQLIDDGFWATAHVREIDIVVRIDLFGNLAHCAQRERLGMCVIAELATTPANHPAKTTNQDTAT